MADLGEAVRGYLIANAGVVALTGQRIYPDVLPQGYTVATGGALTYTIINTVHEHLINGLSGIARSRIEFAAFAGTRAAANVLAEAVRASGLVGTVGTVGGVVIESVMIDGGIQTLDEMPTDGTQDHRYFTVFDYLFAYQETY
jgi:methyl coenzyme M reductase beta subunit